MTYLSTTLFERVRDNTYITLKEMQAGHEKGRSMVHKDLLNPQNYLKTNKLNNKQVGLLFNLRCQSLNGIRDNFHKLYHGDITCRLCLSNIDSQSHLLQCFELKKHMQINPDIIYEHTSRTGHSHLTYCSYPWGAGKTPGGGGLAYRGILIPDHWTFPEVLYCISVYWTNKRKEKEEKKVKQ